MKTSTYNVILLTPVSGLRMERLQSIGLSGISPKLVNTFLPFGIIALVAMLVLPLPVALLDAFFVLI